MPKIGKETSKLDTEPSPEGERKATSIAPANIALIKYWGKKEGNLPYSDTISFNLSGCLTTTTVSFSQELDKDIVIINGEEVAGRKEERVVKHLDLVRKVSGVKEKAHVFSRNSFPSGAGIASSASAFAALTLAASTAAGRKLSQRELSSIARKGSGSASRSIPDGFVLWHKGEDLESSFAESIYPPDYWDLWDFVLILSMKEKIVSSSAGHKAAPTSPYFQERVERNIPERIEKVLKALSRKDIQLLGTTIEEEARELHKIAATSNPPIIYATKETWQVTDEIVPHWRKKGIPTYFTLDAGPNIHIIVPGEYSGVVRSRLEKDLPGVHFIENQPAAGARLIGRHLF